MAQRANTQKLLIPVARFLEPKSIQHNHKYYQANLTLGSFSLSTACSGWDRIHDLERSDLFTPYFCAFDRQFGLMTQKQSAVLLASCFFFMKQRSFGTTSPQNI
jgi:hypothetical protein